MRNRRSDLHGWLVMDKEPGITSFTTVKVVRGILGGCKTGHSGTLDPMATGVLPVALGSATRVAAFAQEKFKAYDFTVTWGEERATDDAQGEVTATSGDRPLRADVEAVLGRFQGTIQQSPPSFSAVHVNGRRAYKSAQRGRLVVPDARPVTVHSLTLLAHENGTSRFHVACGKGTYVRALARDMGRTLGCLGYISELRRTEVGHFSEKSAILLDKLRQIVYTNTLGEYLLPLETVLDDIPAIPTTETQAQNLRHGLAIRVPSPEPESQGAPVKAGAFLEKRLVALGLWDDGVFKPQRVFNHS